MAEQAVPNNLFTASGFSVRYADTPEKRAHLARLPPDKLVTRQRNGKTYYLYADPRICQCVYVGTPEAYRAFQNSTDTSLSGLGGGRDRPVLNAPEEELLTDPGTPSFDNYVFGGFGDD